MISFLGVLQTGSYIAVYTIFYTLLLNETEPPKLTDEPVSVTDELVNFAFVTAPSCNLALVTVPGAKSALATEPSSIPFDPTLLIAISIFIRPDQ